MSPPADANRASRWLVRFGRALLGSDALGHGALGDDGDGRSTSERLDLLAERVWEWREALWPRRPSRGEMTAIVRRMGRRSYREYREGQRIGLYGRRTFLPTDRERIARELRERFPAQCESIVHRADFVARGTFELLGSGPVDMRRSAHAPGWAIDWRRDPITRERYPRFFSAWRWNPYALRRGSADMKGPWELSRSQHFALLGQAWWLTGQRRYAEAFAGFVADHIRRCPPGNGIQWGCAMDVAFRAVNWNVGLSFFQGCELLDDRWWDDYLCSMVEHGRFLAAHLEFGTYGGRVVASNHLLANLVGLHWIALAFPNLDGANVWRGMAEGLLEREVPKQIQSDGSDFESSVPYQRLVIEMLLSSYAMAMHHGAPLSESFRARLLAGLRFVKALRQPSGRQPQIGDADNGRVHILSAYGEWSTEEMDHLLAAGARVLGHPELAEGSDDAARFEAIWWDIDGDVARQAGTHDQVTAPPSPAHDRLSLFADAGLVVGRAGQSWLLLSNGPVGCGGFGNHKHNDQLAIEWVVGRQPLLVDGGSHTYTQDVESRNHFRSTATHNTVMVDGIEQHRMDPALVFRLDQEGSATLAGHVETDGTTTIDASHTAYARLAPALTHERRVTVRSDGSIQVRDRFNGAAGHALRWHFLLHPTVEATLDDLGQIAVLRGRDGAGTLRCADLRFRIEPAWYSPGYGSRLATTALIAESRDGPAEVIIELAPTAAPAPFSAPPPSLRPSVPSSL